jgi:hypothetical protein
MGLAFMKMGHFILILGTGNGMNSNLALMLSSEKGTANNGAIRVIAPVAWPRPKRKGLTFP